MQLNHQHRMLVTLKKMNLKDISYWVAQACKTNDQKTENYLDKKKMN
jgi:hypothetical protein